MTTIPTTRTSDKLNHHQHAAVHRNTTIFRNRLSFSPYLAPIKIFWWYRYPKRFESYRVEKHTHKRTTLQKTIPPRSGNMNRTYRPPTVVNKDLIYKTKTYRNLRYDWIPFIPSFRHWYSITFPWPKIRQIHNLSALNWPTVADCQWLSATENRLVVESRWQLSTTVIDSTRSESLVLHYG